MKKSGFQRLPSADGLKPIVMATTIMKNTETTIADLPLAVLPINASDLVGSWLIRPLVSVILFGCNEAKVTQPVISLVPVDMINTHPIGDGAIRHFPDKAVNLEAPLLVFNPKISLTINMAFNFANLPSRSIGYLAEQFASFRVIVKGIFHRLNLWASWKGNYGT